MNVNHKIKLLYVSEIGGKFMVLFFAVYLSLFVFPTFFEFIWYGAGGFTPSYSFYELILPFALLCFSAIIGASIFFILIKLIRHYSNILRTKLKKYRKDNDLYSSIEQKYKEIIKDDLKKERKIKKDNEEKFDKIVNTNTICVDFVVDSTRSVYYVCNSCKEYFDSPLKHYETCNDEIFNELSKCGVN